MMEQKAISKHLLKRQKVIGEHVEKELISYESLLTRIRNGNRAAAAELVDIFYMQIYAYMRRLGYSSEVSEDLTQQTFLQIWQHIGQLRNSKALNSWIYKVASNVSRLYLRKHKGKQTVNIEDVVLGYEKDNEENVVLNEQLRQLNKILIQMPVKFKEVIIIHYLQGLNISEGSRALGILEGTFKSRLNRGLKILRKELGSGE